VLCERCLNTNADDLHDMIVGIGVLFGSLIWYLENQGLGDDPVVADTRKAFYGITDRYRAATAGASAL